MRVSVNLATRPFADLGPALRRLRIAMGSLAVVVLGLWLGLHLLHGRADKVRAQERALDVGINRLDQEQQGYRRLVAQPQNAAIIDQAGALNALIDKKSFSWTLAMEDLETVLPGGVQVTTLEPIVDKKDGHVAVHMRVVGPRDKAVELVANLEHSRRFLQPRIIGEASETSNNANPNQQLEPVSASSRENFDLLADYNPATPGEREPAGGNRHAGPGATKPRSPARIEPGQS
ncbi:MAG: fimbrial assembly protein, partial [Terracidiphilus sp.]